MASLFDAMLAMNRTYVDFWTQLWSSQSRALVPLDQRYMTSYTTRQDGDQQVIAVGEESLDVSTRRVYGAQTRVRRVVEAVPVERRVELHDETITVERRPHVGEATDDEALAEHEYIMSESREVPVVSKQRRLKEVVVLRKHSTPRVEIVRDVVRRADVQIEQPERTLVVMAQDESQGQQGTMGRTSGQYGGANRDAERGEDGKSQQEQQG
jgi:stress response protein YsnF